MRIRPPLKRELQSSTLRPYQCTTEVDESEVVVTLSENLQAVQSGSSSEGLLYGTYR